MEELENINLGYRSERFEKTLSAQDYIKNYREEDFFIKFCMECPQYNNSWTCPPFEKDLVAELRKYDNLIIRIVKVIPQNKNLPFNLSRKLLLPERIRNDKELRQLERKYNGTAFSYVGSCLYCREGTCTRPSGLSCRHPDKAKPSLEGLGFNVVKTIKDLFEIDILWGKEGKIPDYLILVSALFY